MAHRVRMCRAQSAYVHTMTKRGTIKLPAGTIQYVSYGAKIDSSILGT